MRLLLCTNVYYYLQETIPFCAPRINGAKNCEKSMVTNPITAFFLGLQDMLERYCNLISLSSYLSTKDVRREGAQMNFQEFIASMPEIESALDRLVRAFPLLSLGLAEQSGEGSLGTARTSNSLEVQSCMLDIIDCRQLQLCYKCPSASDLDSSLGICGGIRFFIGGVLRSKA
jgi:hypothetical protein